MTSRAWCFTLNNYTEEDYNSIIDIDSKYLIIGKEVGESGTPHLQGFIRFHNSKRLAGVKKLIPRAHLERAMGNDGQNIEYCSKDDPNPFIRGEPSSPGKRTDLEKVAEEIKDKGYIDAMLDNPVMCIKFHRGCRELDNLIQSRKVKLPPKVHWYWGSSGSGKTRTAYEKCLELAKGNENLIYINNGTLKWFDGYNGQPYVILDEFRKEKDVPLSFILRLLDRYPMKVPVKGSYINWNPTEIFITSCMAPGSYQTSENITQLVRRLTDVVDFTPSEFENPFIE